VFASTCKSGRSVCSRAAFVAGLCAVRRTCWLRPSTWSSCKSRYTQINNASLPSGPVRHSTKLLVVPPGCIERSRCGRRTGAATTGAEVRIDVLPTSCCCGAIATKRTAVFRLTTLIVTVCSLRTLSELVPKFNRIYM
jgi:hypothetical protein